MGTLHKNFDEKIWIRKTIKAHLVPGTHNYNPGTTHADIGVITFSTESQIKRIFKEMFAPKRKLVVAAKPVAAPVVVPVAAPVISLPVPSPEPARPYEADDTTYLVAARAAISLANGVLITQDQALAELKREFKIARDQVDEAWDRLDRQGKVQNHIVAHLNNETKAGKALPYVGLPDDAS